MKKKIFFVEDDANIFELIKATLLIADYDAEGFLDPLLMLERLKQCVPDLLVLDLMLPHMNGYDVIKLLQKKPQYADIPIIILSAKSAELDIVKGLDLGAVDYITKPFGVLEFSSRIKSNLKKSGKNEPVYSQFLKIRNLELDNTKHRCLLCGTVVELTVKEYEILELLMRHPSVVVTRSKMLNVIWGFEYLAETRTLDMHIRSIREKFSKITSECYIETVRGIGYIINE